MFYILILCLRHNEHLSTTNTLRIDIMVLEEVFRTDVMTLSNCSVISVFECGFQICDPFVEIKRNTWYEVCFCELGWPWPWIAGGRSLRGAWRCRIGESRPSPDPAQPGGSGRGTPPGGRNTPAPGWTRSACNERRCGTAGRLRVAARPP